MTAAAQRIERDSMGERSIPADVYYGIQTYRALDNFAISGLKPLPIYVDACLLIKKAAAWVNGELGCIPAEISQQIVAAADEILAGSLRDQFVVDVYQAGAGTSHHMNVNEVLANRALELWDKPKGSYDQLSPNDHVNYGQSTNDVIPTAIRIAALLSLRDGLVPTLQGLASALALKGQTFAEIVKSGRTHLQDAVPVRLGDSFTAYSAIISDHCYRIEAAGQGLAKLGIGGTAAGTGLNTHPEYRPRMVAQLSELTGLVLTPAPHLMAAMQSMAPFVALSGSLRNLAQDCTKLANDLRLLDSGPMTGLKEIQLPPVQPGSSIMPGKYNPVMAEMLNMVCFQVMGLDQAIALCGQAGQLELNVMMPLIAYDLLHSLDILNNALQAFTYRCITRIQAHTGHCQHYGERTLALVTALNPHIGYLKAAEVAHQVLQTGQSVREVVLSQQLMDPALVDQVLDIQRLSQMVE